ncbi:MAG: hypothetical protein AB1445_07895 [Bacillota bacterium]
MADHAARLARWVLLLPNADDLEHLARGRKTEQGHPPCISYMGVLASHLDYPLLKELIAGLPQAVGRGGERSSLLASR